jgi:hypothetical protein
VVRRKGEVTFAALRRLYPHRVKVRQDYEWTIAQRGYFEDAIERIGEAGHITYAGTADDLGFTVIHFKTEAQAAEMERWLADSGLLNCAPRTYKTPAESCAEEEAELIAWGKETRALHVTLKVYRWVRWAWANDAIAFDWAVAVLRTMNPRMHKPNAERAVQVMVRWAEREHKEWISKWPG